MERTTIKLLIVDDDEGDRKQIRRSVKRSGLNCDFSEAGTMDQGLQLFETECFDCVILDYYLPGEDGLHGISAILEKDAHLPVIMTSGQGNERVASEAIKLGAMDYIGKADANESTLRAAIENVLKQSRLKRKIAEQKTALELFTHVVVHDLKAPTQSILGFAKLIEVFLRQEDLDREKIIHQAHRIVDGALRMNALLDELHGYTHAEALPQFEDLHLDEVIRDARGNLDATIDKVGAKVVYGELPTISGDRARLVQLMQNLIGNGIKYSTAEIPEVCISTRPQPDGGTLVEVHDNGIGIPKDQHTRIFEPFVRLHSRDEYDGTGLGLATCKKIVEQHGGKIWCESEVGEGTSFFFTLPAVRDASKETEPENRAASGSNRLSA